MTPSKFKKLVDITLNRCDKVLNSKNREYARNNDKLHNFKVAAALGGDTPENALGGMMKKHTVSIYDYIKDAERNIFHSSEAWDEKIIDHINYLLLLKGLVVEREESNG